MIKQLLAISAGASAGACLRWLLGQGLNALFPAIPPGTLVANLLGGYLIGVALGFFGQHVGLAPEWKLLIITGFLGGLTTFSTFSAEVTAHLQDGRLAWAVGAVGIHVIGSLAMTMLGLATMGAWARGGAFSGPVHRRFQLVKPTALMPCSPPFSYLPFPDESAPSTVPLDVALRACQPIP